MKAWSHAQMQASDHIQTERERSPKLNLTQITDANLIHNSK